MRKLLIGFCALTAAAMLAGCCSYVRIDDEIPPGTLIEGEKPLAVFYVQNISYQLLGFIPWCTGVNWTEDDKPYERANWWRVHFFCDKVSLDNNIDTLARACKEVGSYRIAGLTHTINEDNLWSLLLFNRKTLKTSCFIMQPKK